MPNSSSFAKYSPVAIAAAKKYGVPDDMFIRLIGAESGWRDDVINGNTKSSAGAIGIAQFMPDTAKAMGVDPYDPVASLDASARLLAQLANTFNGNWEHAAAAYNAGPTAILQAVANNPNDWTQTIPAETRTYINKIFGGFSRDETTPPTTTPPPPPPKQPPTDPGVTYHEIDQHGILIGYQKYVSQEIRNTNTGELVGYASVPTDDVFTIKEMDYLLRTGERPQAPISPLDQAKLDIENYKIRVQEGEISASQAIAALQANINRANLEFQQWNAEQQLSLDIRKQISTEYETERRSRYDQWQAENANALSRAGLELQGVNISNQATSDLANFLQKERTDKADFEIAQQNIATQRGQVVARDILPNLLQISSVNIPFLGETSLGAPVNVRDLLGGGLQPLEGMTFPEVVPPVFQPAPALPAPISLPEEVPQPVLPPFPQTTRQ